MSKIVEKMLENADLETIQKMDVPSKNPIHFHDGKWWFWDEIWIDRIGPFDSEEEAQKAIRKYCEEVLGMP